jgi:DUF4097 and DUF4098 domain-containing protein YvlB
VRTGIISPRGWLLATLLAAAPGARGFERVVRQNFPVKPESRLAIDTHRGSIIIQTGAVSEIRVEIHIQPGSEKRDEGDAILQHLSLEMKSEQNTVTLFARDSADTRVRFVWEEKQKINMAYYILVPMDCSLQLKTADGGISVADLKAGLVAHAKRGPVVLKHIAGSVEADTDNAAIVLSHCDSSAKLTDTLGDIRAGTVAGFLEASNTSGDIDIQHAQGGAKVYANAGDITVGFEAGLTHDADIKTNGGAIFVRLDPLAHCTVRASSSPLGKVLTKVAMKVTSGGNKKSVLDADLNGGGPVLNLRAHGGYVEIDPPRI